MLKPQVGDLVKCGIDNDTAGEWFVHSIKPNELYSVYQEHNREIFSSSTNEINIVEIIQRNGNVFFMPEVEE
jgi:hypothetical protein